RFGGREIGQQRRGSPVPSPTTIHFLRRPLTADEESASHICEISENSPHGNTILHHLRTKLELAELERVGKTLIQQDILELLPDRPVGVIADLHLRSYYGEEYDSEEELYESLAKAGTTTFHGYDTLYARVR